MKIINLLANYLYLGKKNETATENRAIKAMHHINRISLLLFLLALTALMSRFIANTILIS